MSDDQVRTPRTVFLIWGCRGCVQRVTLAVRQETNVDTLRALTVSVWEEEVRYPNSQVLSPYRVLPSMSLTWR